MGNPIKDITGQRFGNLTAEKFSCRRNGYTYWLCRCDCGNTKETKQMCLNSGSTRSCGCLWHGSGENNANYKHGKMHTAEYNTWLRMKQRCYNENTHYYKNYGGRGITVCDRWLESYENFLADMGMRPSKTHSLDRINNDEGYSPENCRWGTKTEQSFNRRKPKNNASGIAGVYWCNSDCRWKACIYIFDKRKKVTCSSKEEAIACRKQWEQERAALI
jgi:hypothetical protein